MNAGCAVNVRFLEKACRTWAFTTRCYRNARLPFTFTSIFKYFVNDNCTFKFEASRLIATWPHYAAVALSIGAVEPLRQAPRFAERQICSNNPPLIMLQQSISVDQKSLDVGWRIKLTTHHFQKVRVTITGSKVASCLAPRSVQLYIYIYFKSGNKAHKHTHTHPTHTKS